MGKIKMNSGNKQSEKKEELVMPKLTQEDLKKITDEIKPTKMQYEPIGGGFIPEKVCSCVCPVEIPVINKRIDDVMHKVTELQSAPSSENTKIDSYIKSNNETLKQMSDDMAKLRARVDMAKGEVKVVEKVVEVRDKDQTEKRHEIGLEVDRIEQSVHRKLHQLIMEKDELKAQNMKMEKTMKVVLAASAIITLINIFI